MFRLSKKVCSPLGPLCEGAPPAGGGGENCTTARNISGYGKVLSLRPFGAPLPLWRKRHLPRIGGVCLAEGGFSTRWQMLYDNLRGVFGFARSGGVSGLSN